MNDDNSAKLAAVFAQALGIDSSRVSDELTYNTIPEWDSVAHMALVAALEEAFEVMLDTSDILDLSSVQVARSVLGRHGVAF